MTAVQDVAQTDVYDVPDAYDEKVRTHLARVGRWRSLVDEGVDVRVLAALDTTVRGKTGRLLRTDLADPTGSFLVSIDGVSTWVYDVGPVEPETGARSMYTVPGDLSERQSSLTERLTHASPGQSVFVLAGPSAGKTGVLAEIDSRDPHDTFRVNLPDEEYGQWQYDVQRVSDRTVPDERDAAITALQKEVADLKEQVGLAQNRVVAAERLLQSFKEQVREKAIEVAAENGWCDTGLNETLAELGLDPKTREFEVTVMIEHTFTATMVGSDEVTNQFVIDSIQSGSWSDELPLDSDWENVHSTDASISSVSFRETTD